LTLLDKVLQNPSMVTSVANVGAAGRYLAGKSASPLPGRLEIVAWQQRSQAQAEIGIDASMAGWHEDVEGAQAYIPAWGSALQAVADFQRGDWVLGAARTINAGFELIGVQALVRGSIRMVTTGAVRVGEMIAARTAAEAAADAGQDIIAAPALCVS